MHRFAGDVLNLGDMFDLISDYLFSTADKYVLFRTLNDCGKTCIFV